MRREPLVLHHPDTDAIRQAVGQASDLSALVLVAPDPGERDQQARPHRHPDGLAVERIAAVRVDQHGVRAEGRGVAEQAAHVVVVGDP